MLRVDVPDEDEEPILAAYCPVCAERELAWSAVSTLATQTSRESQRRGLGRQLLRSRRRRGARPRAPLQRALFVQRLFPGERAGAIVRHGSQREVKAHDQV
jgi:hypothetical protein